LNWTLKHVAFQHWIFSHENEEKQEVNWENNLSNSDSFKHTAEKSIILLRVQKYALNVDFFQNMLNHLNKINPFMSSKALNSFWSI
jgi:murein L,D-transpeptidase YafK